jgi:hypothetical protein
MIAVGVEVDSAVADPLAVAVQAVDTVAEIVVERLRCIMRFAVNVMRIARFHSSQTERSRSFAVIVSIRKRVTLQSAHMIAMIVQVHLQSLRITARPEPVAMMLQNN